MIIKTIQQELNNLDKTPLNKLSNLIKESSQIILIGNGGSNAIASHIAVDYIKFLNKKTLCFSDPSMLTAYINDYSSDLAYAKYIESMKDDNTLVILITSSGNSKNIYLSAEYCRNNQINLIILTGFDSENPLRRDFKDYAKLEYWVDSKSYGVVECIHQIFLHAIIDN